MVLTADEEVVAFHALYLEAEPLIERLCIEVVSANGQLDASNGLGVSLGDCRLQELCAEPLVTCVRNQPDAKVTNMRPGFAVDWQDIAPADNLPVLQCNELTKIVRDNVPIEGKRLFQRWRLQEGEELLLAGNNVQRVMQPGEVLLSGGKNRVAHDAQRRGVRRASTISRYGAAVAARPHHLALEVLLAPRLPERVIESLERLSVLILVPKLGQHF